MNRLIGDNIEITILNIVFIINILIVLIIVYWGYFFENDDQTRIKVNSLLKEISEKVRKKFCNSRTIKHILLKTISVFYK